ncbi:hypothetical protein GF380_01425 [Candidatus Uhrbacteria bacterium]|nr:hypothetical protein [Candidatus Uhrbacteria bacterium]MBD3283940.1 hypothetical protein [Candidatus Uhrbacteria bacterium]
MNVEQTEQNGRYRKITSNYLRIVDLFRQFGLTMDRADDISRIDADENYCLFKKSIRFRKRSTELILSLDQAFRAEGANLLPGPEVHLWLLFQMNDAGNLNQGAIWSLGLTIDLDQDWHACVRAEHDAEMGERPPESLCNIAQELRSFPLNWAELDVVHYIERPVDEQKTNETILGLVECFKNAE